MSPFEISTGWLTGFDPPERGAPRPVRPRPIDALEQAMLPLVASPPCVVAFSGGVDSSLVLAAAMRVATRHGLPSPIAATRTFPSLPDATESEWQDLVIRHLGVSEWTRLPIDDELDLLGPLARSSLVRNGVIWPPMSHVNTPLFDVARGGTLVAGEGGDTLLGAQRISPVTCLVRRLGRPSRVRISAAARSLAPATIRRAACRREIVRAVGWPWLRPAARAELLDRLVADEVSEPLDHRAAVRRWTGQRALRVGLRTMEDVAGDHGVRLAHPLLAAPFVEAVAVAGGRLGFAGRSQLMSCLFADVLPAALVRRPGKATFNGAAFGVHSRAFAGEWDGSGVDHDLVDPVALRREWLAPTPSAMSFALLQAAWLHGTQR